MKKHELDGIRSLQWVREGEARIMEHDRWVSDFFRRLHETHPPGDGYRWGIAADGTIGRFWCVGPED